MTPARCHHLRGTPHRCPRPAEHRDLFCKLHQRPDSRDAAGAPRLDHNSSVGAPVSSWPHGEATAVEAGDVNAFKTRF